MVVVLVGVQGSMQSPINSQIGPFSTILHDVYGMFYYKGLEVGMLGDSTFFEATRISTCHNFPKRNPALPHPELASRWKIQGKRRGGITKHPTGTVCGACFTSPDPH